MINMEMIIYYLDIWRYTNKDCIVLLWPYVSHLIKYYMEFSFGVIILGHIKKNRTLLYPESSYMRGWIICK